MKTNTTLPLRDLGKTGIRITPIGLGVMELAGGGGLLGRVFPVIPPEEKNAIIRAALDGGINFFDTAEMYGLGVSEAALATGLKTAGKSDGEVVIETKWFPLLRTARDIPRSIDTRLRFLGGYTISNYMIHQPISLSSPEAEMNALADLVETGRIRSAGVSNFSPERMRRAHRALEKRGLPLALNQVRYSLLDRRIEANGVLESARELGVTIVAYTPLEHGLLTGRYHRNPELVDRLRGARRADLQRKIARTRPLIQIMDQIAAKYEATVAQVALNWLIHFKGDLVVTIPGASKAHQAAECAGALRFRLSEVDLARLDEESKKL